MTIGDDALRRHAAKYVDDPADLDAFVEDIKARRTWRTERGFKTCSTCGQDKKPGEFTLNSARRDGLHDACRECEKARDRARRG